MNNRIEWIDIAKGIAIILVVYGHAGLANIPLLEKWVCAFHMPFFFFISGILFSVDKYPTINKFLQRRWKTLIRPYLFFSIICLLAYWYLDPDHILTKSKSVLLYGWGGVALWFIPVLILTELLYFIIRKYISNQTILTLTLLGSAVIGWVSYKLNLPDNYNFWFIFTAVLFYGSGNLLNRVLKYKFNEYSKKHLFIIAILTATLSMTYLLNEPKPEFFINKLGSIFTYPAAIGGTLFMCCCAVWISRGQWQLITIGKKITIFFGKNSYVVLAFHQIILLILGKMHVTNIGSIQRIIMWIILSCLILFINKYAPFILGRSSQSAK